MQVGAGAGHQLAGRRTVVVVEGELVDLVVELRAKVGLDAVAGAHRHVAADGGGETLDRGESDDGHGEREEKLLVAATDGFVDGLAGEDGQGDTRAAPDERHEERGTESAPAGAELIQDQRRAGA